jgi:hypothetical protein
MLKVVRLALVPTFSCVTAELAQNPETRSTPPPRSANKDTSPQGSGTQAATNAADKTALGNKPTSAETQPPPAMPIVKCAIRLPNPVDQSVSGVKRLNLAKTCHNSSEDEAYDHRSQRVPLSFCLAQWRSVDAGRQDAS